MGFGPLWNDEILSKWSITSKHCLNQLHLEVQQQPDSLGSGPPASENAESKWDPQIQMSMWVSSSGKFTPSPFLHFRVLKPCAALIFFSPIKISEMKYFYPFPSEEHLLFWLPNPPWNKAKVQWNSSIPRREKQLLCPLHYLSPGFYSLSRVFPAPRPCHLIALQPQMFLSSLETLVTDSSAVCCVAGSHFLLL